MKKQNNILQAVHIGRIIKKPLFRLEGRAIIARYCLFLRLFSAFFVLFLSLLILSPASASVFVIRDSEVENLLRVLGHPVIKAAGLDASDIRFYILSDSSPNAFVTGRQEIFVTLGLLEQADDPAEIKGVLAHEVGHITSHHVAGQKLDHARAGKFAMATVILSALAGPTEAIYGGLAGVGATESLRLKTSRADEQAADQAAVRILKKVNVSPLHLAKFGTKLLKQQEGIVVPDYLQTHPGMANRIAFLRETAKGQKLKPSALEQRQLLLRVQARIRGYFNPLETTLKRYPSQNTSLSARYGRISGWMRYDYLAEAEVGLIDLVKKRPKDPFVLEMMGELKRKQGKFAEAETYFARALERAPWSGLLRIARAEIIFQQAELKISIEEMEEHMVLLEKARREVKKGLAEEPDHLLGWWLLANIESRKGNEGERSLALVEAAWVRRDLSEFRRWAQNARETLDPENREARLRLADLTGIVAKIEEKN